MERKRIIRQIQVLYKLDVAEIRVLKDFLAGKLSSREAGAKLNISHQQVINLVASMAQTWYQEGKLKI